jgi:hypothetical protein
MLIIVCVNYQKSRGQDKQKSEKIFVPATGVSANFCTGICQPPEGAESFCTGISQLTEGTANIFTSICQLTGSTASFCTGIFRPLPELEVRHDCSKRLKK